MFLFKNYIKKYLEIKNENVFLLLLQMQHNTTNYQTFINKYNFETFKALNYYKDVIYYIYNWYLENDRQTVNKDYIIKKYKIDKKYQNDIFDYEEKNINDEIETIQSLIKTKTTPYSIICYRLCNEEEYKNWEEAKKHILIKKFTSTTAIPEITKKQELFKNTKMIKILIPKGTTALAIPDITSETKEFEFLLPYGTTFKKVKSNDKILTFRVCR